MPDFPPTRSQRGQKPYQRYESKRQLTTQEPYAKQQTRDVSGQITAQWGELGKEVANQSLQWAKVHSAVNQNESKMETKAKLDDINARRAVDPEAGKPDVSAKYDAEIDEAVNEGLSNLDFAGDRRTLAPEFEYYGNAAKIQGLNITHKLEIDRLTAQNLAEKDAIVAEGGSLEDIKAIFNDEEGQAVFSREQAYKEIKQANDDLGVNRIEKDLYNAQTPEQVEAVSQKITSGGYEKGGVTIDPAKKNDLLDIVERTKKNTEKKVEAAAVTAMAQNRVDTVLSLASGEKQFEDVNLTDISEYDATLATTIQKVKPFLKNYNPKLTPEEQTLASAGLTTKAQVRTMREYAKSIREFFLQNDNEKLGEFMLRELEKQGDGRNPSVKLAAFVNLAALKFSANNPQTEEDNLATKALNSIKAGISFLQDANPAMSYSTISEFVVKNYLSGKTDMKEVMEESRETLNSQMINRYKSLVKLPSMPNKIVDGEASVEDLQSGLNRLKGEKYRGIEGD